MTTKEALIMMKLGCKMRRPHWDIGGYIEAANGRVVIHFASGNILRDSVNNFLTQEHTDWEVYIEPA